MSDEVEIITKKKEKEPLGLPKSSVRAILVLTSLFAAISMIYHMGNPPEWFIALVTMAFGFYFGARLSA